MVSRGNTLEKIMTADEATLARVDELLSGKVADAPQDRKLLNFKQAADALGVSKTTVRRLIRDGRLATVETRLGRRRIMSKSITDFALGAATHNTEV